MTGSGEAAGNASNSTDWFLFFFFDPPQIELRPQSDPFSSSGGGEGSGSGGGGGSSTTGSPPSAAAAQPAWAMIAESCTVAMVRSAMSGGDGIRIGLTKAPDRCAPGSAAGRTPGRRSTAAPGYAP